jgi:hypothetical protein
MIVESASPVVTKEKGRRVRFGVTIITTDLVWRIDGRARSRRAASRRSTSPSTRTSRRAGARHRPPAGRARRALQADAGPLVLVAPGRLLGHGAVATRPGIASSPADPIVTAKAIATLDHLSDRRDVDLGVGYGWNVDEMEHQGRSRTPSTTSSRARARHARCGPQRLPEFTVSSWTSRRRGSGPSRYSPAVPRADGRRPGPKLFAAIAEYCDGWLPPFGAGVREALPCCATPTKASAATVGPFV